MKLEVSEWQIVLRPENDEDRELLDKFDREGVIVGHTGSTLGIHSPIMSGRRALYIDRDEQALLSFALGRIAGIDQAESHHYIDLLNVLLLTDKNDPDYIRLEESENEV